MKKICAGIVVALAFVGSAHAQTTRELAFKLAEAAVDDSFKEVRPMLMAAFDNLEKDASANGKSDRTLSIFIEEVKNSFNRENFIKAIGDVWEREMTRAELQEALNFMTSPTGRKFQVVSKTMKEPRNLAPIFREACNRARSRVQAIATNPAELDRVCAQFQ
ncbi:DUF2059 domain-containing protein [Rhodoferax saidenbachensis]|uniref:DUF2059 domain-containing protein n=1 Tax=Rhodoferax saidenbachensis TaxID=1484693 RepID=A0ABU1ZIP9_9BURK|nr:DUF2059 domain-containing protein [Rhodoferax saidenbachensis]MDR7305414.1 hypothetical protein [Rhodoferax saidenbachensis]